MAVQDQQRRQGGAETNPPWNARQRTLIRTMGSYLKNSEKIHVEINALEHFLIGPGEDATNMTQQVRSSGRNELGHRSG